MRIVGVEVRSRSPRRRGRGCRRRRGQRQTFSDLGVLRFWFGKSGS
jgi:hypothetical protein